MRGDEEPGCGALEPLVYGLSGELERPYDAGEKGVKGGTDIG